MDTTGNKKKKPARRGKGGRGGGGGGGRGGPEDAGPAKGNSPSRRGDAKRGGRARRQGPGSAAKRGEKEKGRADGGDSSPVKFHIAPFRFLVDKRLPKDDQHKMRKFVLSALDCTDELELLCLLKSPMGIENVQLIAQTKFCIDARDRKNRHSFQAIAVPFCHLLIRVATNTDLKGVMLIFTELCRSGSTFFTLDDGSAISCLLQCCDTPELIFDGAGRDDETKHIPRSLQEVFETILMAIRQLMANMHDEPAQLKWRDILSRLEPHVPDSCLSNFTRIASFVQLPSLPNVRLTQSSARPPFLAASSDLLPGELCASGSRHNNDHVKYRHILQLPTAEEMNSPTEPYLPRQFLRLDGDNRGSAFVTDDVDRHLDIHFRLLREDMLRTLRVGVQAIADAGGLGKLPATFRHRLSSGLRFVVMRNVRVLGFKPSTRTPLCFSVSFDHPSPKTKNFWDPKSCRLLRHGQLVSLLFATDHDLSIMATVCGKVEAGSTNGVPDSRCSVQLQLVVGNERNIGTVVEHCTSNADIGLLEVSGVQIFAYKPILQALQLPTPGLVPFLQRVVPTASKPHCALVDALPAFMTDSTVLDLTCLVQPGVPCPSLLKSVNVSSFRQLDELLGHASVRDSLRMDRTQAQAFAAALTRDVSLIQGPPGTGKTFVGVEILRALLANSGGHAETAWHQAERPEREIDGKPLLEPILCITFTNHALDQLLEHLLDEKIASESDIVRLGGRSKSERLEKCMMYQQERVEKNRFDKRRLYELHEEAEPLIDSVGEHLQFLSARALGQPKWAQRVLRMISMIDEDLYSDLNRELEAELDRGFMDLDGAGALSILHRRSRREWQQFQDLSYRECLQSIARDLEKLQLLSEDLERVQTGVQLRVAKSKRVIGVTTTGCAKASELIRSLRPRVIICEEAGEVLESHMLSALTSGTEALILIGDHLQLRPKPAIHELSIESDHGYDLDVSLFERLIISNAPSVMLLEQRRMQAGISSILRQTLYPKLQDHASVLLHPPLRGFAKSLMFFDHDHAESQSDASTSKTNAFEAAMITALVEYSVRNGYVGSQIAVLTPYLGQLRSIRASLTEKRLMLVVDEVTQEELNSEFEDELAVEELEAAASLPLPNVSVESLRDCVRLSTVDNFQGEEADIVIISTVRCNEHGNVGFLKIDNRVNVMLSRARHGMIILGSARTIQKKQKKPLTMFQAALSLLNANDAVVRKIPLLCQQHPYVVTEVEKPANFPMHGGCDRLCSERLSCGHSCRRYCHPDNRNHLAMACKEDCAKVLDCGHKCREQCSSVCKCTATVTLTLACGHGVDVECDKAEAFKSGKAKIPCKRPVTLTREQGKLSCGHFLEKALCGDVKSQQLTCKSECGAKPWACGHACTRNCASCRAPGGGENHGVCTHPCGRGLLCGHLCTAEPCHDASSCPPCKELCAIRCEHSRCPLPCKESCIPCAEPCSWKCTVQHERPLACERNCGSACTRPPCDVRCDKELRCGHRCPSLCGEPCPEHWRACPTCAAEGKLAAEYADFCIDYVNMTALREHAVDGNDVGSCLIQLECAHLFTVEYLDSKTGLDRFYETTRDGAWGPGVVVDFLNSTSDRHVGECDHCKKPLRGSRRYSRPLKSREIELMDVKWSHRCKLTLQEVETLVSQLPALTGERPSNKHFAQLKKLEKQATLFFNQLKAKSASPAERCTTKASELVPAARKRAAVARAHAHAALMLAKVERAKLSSSMTGSQRTATSESDQGKAEKFYADQCELYRSGKERAKEGLSKTALAILQRIHAKSLLLAFDCFTHSNSPLGSRKRTVDALEELLGEAGGALQELQSAVDQLRRAIDNSPPTTEEKRAILEVLGRDVGTGIGGYGGHWYQCPNGHPYAIGECGGAMESSACIDCGERIGGGSHRLARNNTVATSLLQEVGRELPNRRSAALADEVIARQLARELQ